MLVSSRHERGCRAYQQSHNHMMPVSGAGCAGPAVLRADRLACFSSGGRRRIILLHAADCPAHTAPKPSRCIRVRSPLLRRMRDLGKHNKQWHAASSSSASKYLYSHSQGWAHVQASCIISTRAKEQEHFQKFHTQTGQCSLRMPNDVLEMKMFQ